MGIFQIDVRGSGIVISKGAMKLMMDRIDICIMQQRHCWAGDIRTGLCLKDVGVELTHRFEFNSNPPGNYLRWRHPCIQPATFHHLLVPQMQAMYDFEQELYYSGIIHPNYAHLAQRYLSETIVKDASRLGDDLGVKRAANAQRCQQMCKRLPTCLAFVFEPPAYEQNEQDTIIKDGVCRLHSVIIGITQSKTPGVQTGVVPGHYQCRNWFNLFSFR
jgi:hypothetical protein